MSGRAGPAHHLLDILAAVAPLRTWGSAAVIAILSSAIAYNAGAGWASSALIFALLLLAIPLLLRRGGRDAPVDRDPAWARHRRAVSPVMPADLSPVDRAAADRAAHDEEFDEDLELTVWVGENAAGDRVEETRLTRPHHAINGRALTLVSPYVEPDARPAPVVPELSFDTEAVRAHWQHTTVPGRGVVLFDAPVSARPLRWIVSYGVPGGLWNPLRCIGLDVFRYDVRQFQIGNFAVRFIVHGSAHKVFIQERNGRGRVTGYDRDPDGSTVVTWTSDYPAAAVLYEWDLRVVWRD
ncbi:hypothetical protein [Jidongwangia harbinensis]|uniref:hypothetical protein n=1 Tax=Jidongwangia harbinensis TaxID=2878561 RepID=UPI001CDA2ED1|nr:hypothetical protein [Jidongwangia harbinensis]MCA2219079.1 hypothetical protein [Jidongwangia harbinensis]